MWFVKIRKKPKKRRVNLVYKENKEKARRVILERLEYFAPLCGVEFKRVAIRDTKRNWGSCSSLGNLNFNYKLLFLPDCLRDYVVVHELCHLKELNHSPKFWSEVEKILPDYKLLKKHLRLIEKNFGTSCVILRSYQKQHNAEKKCKYCVSCALGVG